MSRLAAALKTDVRVQFRNRLYHIGLTFAVLAGWIVSLLAPALGLARIIPVTMLLLVGGSTLLYVVGLFTFEKEEGTLSAVIVSPLRPWEYLLSKVLTLTALASLESLLIVAVAGWFLRRGPQRPPIDALPLLAGILALGVFYTLIGIVIMVRYSRVTDALMPVLFVAIPLQLPFLHFLGLWEHPLFLLLPTSAPTLLMVGAYRPLASWEWGYAVACTAAWTAGLSGWAYAAFRKHVIMRAG
jgi:fluoroquinolone transport system permease protein